MSDFIQIHNHTQYSRWDGFASVRDLVSTAKKFGMKSVGITDHGTFAGAIDFLRECRKQNIRPILGMEAYLARDHTVHNKEGQPDGRKGNRHINLIAKNYVGFQNICTLSQIASLEGTYYDPRVDGHLLEKYSEGVIVTSACLSNVVNWHLSTGAYNEAKQCVGIFKDIYGGDYYLEMMFHGIDSEARILSDIQKLGKETDVKIIVTNDCFVAGTMVLTKRGVIPIENVNIGDCVVTHKNRLAKVVYTNKRVVSSIYDVKTALGTSSLKCTWNHRVLTVQRMGNKNFTYPQWKKISSLVSEDYLLIHKHRHANHAYNVKCCQEFIDIPSVIGELYNEDIYGKFYITQQGFDGRRGKIKIPIRLKVCKDLLFILGRYIAEGGHDRGSYQISFAANCAETEVQDRIEAYFSKFGVTCYRPRKDNDCKIVFTSKIFKALFTTLCGAGAENKHLPLINGSYYVFSKNQMLEILRGYIGGGGYITKKKNGSSVICATTSRLLSYQISDILHVLGFISMPTVRNHKKVSHKNPKATPNNWNPLYVLHMSEADIGRFCREIGFHRSEYKHSTISRRKFIDIGDYFAIKVKSIHKRNEESIVYNLQVNKDETYVANSYIVHNCHYINKSDAEFHEVVMCINSGKCVKDPRRLKFPYSEFYFKSEKEMSKIFGNVNKYMQNTLEIADKCDYSDIVLGGKMLLPKFELPEEYDSPHKYLRDLAYSGLKKIGLDGSPKHVERLETELSDIELVWDTHRYDFATYFLIVEDIMRFAKENGVAAGIRGSGYGSLLCKCLGIIEGPIDCLEQNLLWERFLGFDKKFFISDDDFVKVSE